jgi:hypothetical protein
VQNPVEKRIILTLVEGSLKPYGLDETTILTVKKVTCIYIFIEPVSKKFDIEETGNDVFERMERHKIFANSEIVWANLKVEKSSDVIYVNVGKDLSKITDRELIFSIRKYMEGSSDSERCERENHWKKILTDRYGKDRMYNVLNLTKNSDALCYAPAKKAAERKE